MKRIMINFGSSLLLGFGLTMVIWLMFLPPTQAAPAAPPLKLFDQASAWIMGDNNKPLFAMPPAKPHAVYTPTIVDDPFQSHPSTEAVSIGFDSSTELTNWTSLPFYQSKGTASVTNGQLVLNHTNGVVEVAGTSNRHYIFYRNQPIYEPSYVEVVVVSPPVLRAGLELWESAPINFATYNSGGNRVLLSLVKISGNYQLSRYTRQGSTIDKKTLAVTNDFPITLRIKRARVSDANASFSFWYKTNSMSSFTEFSTAATPSLIMYKQLYFGVIGSNFDDNEISTTYSQSIFDNATYVFTYTLPTALPNWTTKIYGNVSFNMADTDSNGRLILQSGGSGVTSSDDGTAGYFALYLKNQDNTARKIPALGGMTATVQMIGAPTVEGGIGGLEIRNEVDQNNSPKIAYGLSFQSGQYKLVAFSRNSSGAITTIANNQVVDLATPMWLRMVRAKNNGPISFYYCQKSSAPVTESEWTLYATTASVLVNNSYVGLFNASNSGTDVQTSLFDNFKVIGLSYAADPIAGLTLSSNSPTYVNQPTNFVSTVTQGDDITYKWNYGNGSSVTSTATTISYTYTKVGTYIATVTGTNSQNSQSATTIVTVLDPPITDLTLSSNSPKAAGQDVQFTALITGAKTGVTYTWNFGDGKSYTGGEADYTVRHKYTIAGNYTVILTANNTNNSLSTSTAVLVNVVCDTAISGLTVSQPTSSEAKVGQTITFQASKSIGVVSQTRWDFGDGTTSSSQSGLTAVTHAFLTPGTYTVIVTATNNCEEKSASKQITVPVPDTPITDLALTNDGPKPANNSILFTISKTSGKIVDYVWDFGDGSTGTGVPVTNGLTKTRSYTQPGTYHVILTATNSSGSQTASTDVTIDSNCAAPFTGLTITQPKSPSVKHDPLGIYMEAKAVGGGTKVFYQWDFGDGTTSPKKVAFSYKHVYTYPGTYNATVVASNNCYQQTESMKITVYGTPKLTINKSAPIAVAVSERISYNLVVANIGNDTANNVTVEDFIPQGVTYVSSNNNGAYIDDGFTAPSVQWKATSLVPSQTLTLTFVVQTSADPGQVVNAYYKVNGQDTTFANLPEVIGSISRTTLVERPPVVNAGELIGAAPNEQVTLDGSRSYDPQGNPLTYQWQQISGFPVTLVGENTARPVFITPPYPQLGDIGFRLTAFSKYQLSHSGVTTVSVTYDPILRISTQGPLVVNPGDLITYTISLSNIGTAPAVGAVITNVMPEGANYVRGGQFADGIISWALDDLAVKASTAVSFVVTATEGSIINRNYSVLSVQGAKARGVVVARTRINLAPIADAGPAQTMLAKSPVELNSVYTQDPDGDKLTYHWTQIEIEGPTVSLDDPNAAFPKLTAPSTDATLRFRLEVVDPYGLRDIDETEVIVSPWTTVVGSNQRAAVFNCDNNEKEILAKNGVKITNGTSTIYIGQNSTSATKDPIVAKFTNEVRDWCRVDYEVTPDDGTGYGLLWDGGDELYGVFNSRGMYQGNDFRRFANNRWLNSYVDFSKNGGSGPYASVVAKIFPASGSIDYATYLTSLDNQKRTNALAVTSLAFSQDKSNLIVKADAGWSPRQLDKKALFCSGYPPFDYSIVFDTNLIDVITATAVGCSDVFVPLTKLTINGTTTGWVDTPYNFKTEFEPSDATTPITYTWLPDLANMQNTATYSWSVTGTHVITVLASNNGGVDTVSKTATIAISTIPVTAPTAITLNGPTTGWVGYSYQYSATISPLDVTMPLTYTWLPMPEKGQGTARPSYNWDGAGSQVITVMVNNAVGSVSATQLITVNQPGIEITAPVTITINGASICLVNSKYNFSATVMPSDVSEPLSYQWLPMPDEGQGTNQVAYSWTTTGSQTISLTVNNAGGAANSFYTVMVSDTVPSPTPTVTPSPTVTPTPDGKPKPSDDAITAKPGQPTIIPVLSNDAVTTGSLVISQVGYLDPARGAVVISGSVLVYTPPTTFTGSASFTYTICDNEGACNIGRVTVIVTGNSEIVATPINTTTTVILVFTDTQSGKIVTKTVELPTRVVTTPFVLVYTPLSMTTQVPPAKHLAAKQQFILEAYVEGELQPTYVFNPPLIMTVTYRSEDVANLNIATLHLRYWDKVSLAWSVEGITTMARYPAQNQIVSSIAHLTEFSLFGEPKGQDVYLPLIFKK